MPQPSRTQKQIAEKYKGNLDYFKKRHVFRRIRSLLCLLALVGGIAGVVLFKQFGADSFYNAGPLSENHAHLKNDCKSCHAMQNGSVAGLLALAKGEAGAPNLSTITKHIFSGESAREIDHACLKCHEGHQLHQPDAQMVAIRDMRREVSLVHAGSCSSCHKEHKGPAPMKMPTSASCAACHADGKRMMETLEKIDLHGKNVSQVALTRQIQPGTWQFIPPQKSAEPAVRPRLFASFEKGHPPFGYEQSNLLDPDVLKFNHQRHEAADIPKVNGRKLDCAYCHKPAGDGTYYQRISFEASCVACHSLLFDPKNPELQIPHGDPAAVRAYLRSLPFQYADLAGKKGFKTPQQVNGFVAQQMLQLKDRVRSGEDFEKQVFFTSNPYKTQPATAHTLFPGCAYCHEVKPGVGGTPVITPPVMADRWLQHGRFTHAKHTSVACIDCHAARHSKDTTDILMPPMKSCAECHRTHTDAEAKVASQKSRQQAGASAECLSCHTFHSAPSVAASLEPNPLPKNKRF